MGVVDDLVDVDVDAIERVDDAHKPIFSDFHIVGDVDLGETRNRLNERSIAVGGQVAHATGAVFGGHLQSGGNDDHT